jgi:uncharacterized protein YdaU (DUF1376 family)
MSAVDTWMPLYIGDYLADTGHLTAAEHGAYLLLLMQQWRRGWLPDDDMQLSRMVRMRVEHWRRIAGNVRAFFAAGEMPGTLQQKRLHAEREKALSISQKRADAARAKAKVQADATPSTPGSQGGNMHPGFANGSTSKPLETLETTSANAEQMQVVCTHNHNHKDKKESKEGKKTRSATADGKASPPILPEWLPSEAWAAWCLHRGRKFTQQQAEFSLRELGKLRAAGHDPTEVIEKSIASGWTGLFPLKRTGSHHDRPGKLDWVISEMMETMQ